MIRRLLLVEDDADELLVLGRGLRRAGFETLLAGNGREALALARLHKPEAVLIDVGLPDVDGYELARCLRADAGLAGAWLVAVTGLGSSASRERSQQAGFDRHWAKPVNLNELAVFLEKLEPGGSAATSGSSPRAAESR